MTKSKEHKKFISVVIAAFNEEGNIKQLTERIVKTLQTKYNYEIIYVVAGTDKTLNIIKSFKNKNIKVLYDKNPNGLGNDFKKGFKKISTKADYVVTMDADLNHQPEEIPRLLKHIDQYDIIIGSRHVAGGKVENTPCWKKLISGIANVAFIILSGLKIKDKTSGFRVYKRKIIMDLANSYSCRNFEFLLEMLLIAKKKKYTMFEAPITFKYRVNGQSKFRIIKTAIGYLKLIRKIR
jgi:dolichol-phosphate mannosyltransferase